MGGGAVTLVSPYETSVGRDVRVEEEAYRGACDLILLDVMLPGKDGFQVCKSLRDRGRLLRREKDSLREVALNTQEYRLLVFLADHPDRILRRNELLDGVWDTRRETSTRTVDVHIAWLRQKLGEKDRPRHIITHRGRGYKFVAQTTL